MILIKNTLSRLMAIQHKIGVDGQGNDRHERIVLLPGVNQAPENWEQVKQHPLVAKAIDESILEEIDTHPGAKPGAKSPEDLSGVNEKRAIQLVKETLSPVLLQKWLNSEKRDKVLSAIREQIAATDPRNNKEVKAS